MERERSSLEVWGGLECTINRVHHTWMDQLERAGHYGRLADFDAIAALGIRTLRYGLPWERFCQTGSLETFASPLAAMQRLGITPIAGLVHHGSGPADTDLLDPHFPEKLAGYALQVAQRFPHLDHYTPVNEPQTTARFSGLYGHWYPHHRSVACYLRMLLVELKATVLAMRAVRTVRPDAQLISTEDGGRIWYTAPLEAFGAERAARRWLGTDLLCGRVDRAHPMFAYLRRHGLAEPDILWFGDNPCPPDVLGLNYYLTSDRFLDDRTALYPESFAGGDTGTEPFVDIEALRVREGGIAGAGQILQEAWDRYGLPVAITECHLGGGPEDQITWLYEVWCAALEARRSGADVRAVTVWALLGSFDWDSLVTQNRGHYEPGVFNIASGTPLPTPYATAVQRLAEGRPPQLAEPGWWHHPDRLTFAPGREA